MNADPAVGGFRSSHYSQGWSRSSEHPHLALEWEAWRRGLEARTWGRDALGHAVGQKPGAVPFVTFRSDLACPAPHRLSCYCGWRHLIQPGSGRGEAGRHPGRGHQGLRPGKGRPCCAFQTPGQFYLETVCSEAGFATSVRTSPSPKLSLK